MELATTRPRRIAWSLIGVLVALAMVRLYYELLVRHQADLQHWFSRGPIRPLLLLALAVAICIGVASGVRRRLGRRLVIPCAMVAGALTAGLHTSLTGMVVGFLVGLLYTSDHLFRFSAATLRALAVTLPLMILACVVAFLSRRAHFADSPWLASLTVPLYVLAGLVAAGLVVFDLVLQWRQRFTSGEAVTKRSGWRSVFRFAVRTLIVVAAVSCAIAIGLHLGWQLDIYRRACALERVGAVGWWTPLSPRQWLGGGLMTVADVHLGEAATDDHLKLLRGMPGIAWLSIDSTRITDKGCREFAKLPNLKSLWLERSSIHDEGLRQLAGLQQLQSLRVSRTPITRDAFAVLPTLPLLDYIAFENVMPQGNGLARLSLTPGLNVLSLRDCGITDADLAALAQNTFVQYLDLSGNQIRGPGLRYLSKHVRLGTLNLNRNPLDASYLKHLPVVSLTGIMIDGAPFTPAACEAVMRQWWLQDLSLRESGITSDQLRRIVSLPYLQDAQLDATNLSPRSLIGWRQRDVTLWIEHQTLEARDITRLGEIGPDVVLSDCELAPGAIAELANYRGIFSAQDCRTQPRFEPILRRYTTR